MGDFICIVITQERKEGYGSRGMARVRVVRTGPSNFTVMNGDGFSVVTQILLPNSEFGTSSVPALDLTCSLC